MELVGRHLQEPGRSHSDLESKSLVSECLPLTVYEKDPNSMPDYYFVGLESHNNEARVRVLFASAEEECVDLRAGVMDTAVDRGVLVEVETEVEVVRKPAQEGTGEDHCDIHLSFLLHLAWFLLATDNPLLVAEVAAVAWRPSRTTWFVYDSVSYSGEEIPMSSLSVIGLEEELRQKCSRRLLLSGCWRGHLGDWDELHMIRLVDSLPFHPPTISISIRISSVCPVAKKMTMSW
jgi:hypothetical protein